MDTLVKKYENLATLCSLGIVLLVLVMMLSCQYLEKEETVVAAFVVVSISTMSTMFLVWLRKEFKDTAKDYANYKGRL
jgi:hypothetical protein